MPTIMVTGGTGSLGSRFIDFVYRKSGEHKFVVFSRDEQKQYQMRLKYNESDRIAFVLGDVRDPQSVMDAVEYYKPSIVLHTAAQKHIKICEHNPMQTVATNIQGTKHVARACIANDVRVACFISTDKAVNPTTLYGASKLIAERIWVNAPKRLSCAQTHFIGTRSGNIMNSAGSLLPLYKEIAKKKNPVFPLTDERMTRFFVTFSDMIGFILARIQDHYILNFTKLPVPAIHCVDQETFYIPSLVSVKIKDVAEIFAEKFDGTVDVIGPFSGEKLHEELVPGHSSADFLLSLNEVRQLLLDEELL